VERGRAPRGDLVSAVLSSAERERLVKILGLLSSDHDGERAAAGLQASRLMRARNLTWDDVLGSAVSVLSMSGMPPWPSPGTACPASRLGDMHLVLRNLALLGEWERGFIRSVAHCPRWSPKQAARFAEIVDKVRAKAARGRT